MHTPKLLFFVAVWKRPEITEICFMGINRLRKLGLYEVEALAVISEDSMIPLCEKYGIHWTMHENQPLGAKKNHGLKEALKLKWDHLIEIGSDDVLKNEWLQLIGPYLVHDWFGIDHFVYLNSEDGACRQYKTRNSFGLGRCISRKVVEKIGPLWNDRISKGLDNDSYFRIARHGFLEKRLRTDYPLGIDIKSPTNIWPFNYLVGREYPLEEALMGLGEDEKNAINALINASVETADRPA